MPFQAVLDDPDAAPYRPDAAGLSPGVLLGGQRYPSLVAALLAARDGDVLHLEEGTHRGPVEIDRKVALFPAASGGQVRLLSAASHAVRVGQHGDVLLRGLEIRAQGAHTAGAEGAVMLLGGRLVLEDCRLSAPGNAALYQSGGDLTVTRGGLTSAGWSEVVHLGRDGLARFDDVTVVAGDDQGVAVSLEGTRAEFVGGSLEAPRACLALGPGAAASASLVRMVGGGLDAGPDSRVVITDSELLESRRAALTCAGDVRLLRCRLLDHPVAARILGRRASLRLEHVTSVNIPRPIVLEDGALKGQVTLVATEFPDVLPPR